MKKILYASILIIYSCSIFLLGMSVGQKIIRHKKNLIEPRIDAYDIDSNGIHIEGGIIVKSYKYDTIKIVDLPPLVYYVKEKLKNQ